MTKSQLKICLAAIDLFAEKGYAGASLQAIARKAGMSDPTPFRLFGTKHNLFECAVFLALERARFKFTPPYGDGFKETIRAFVDNQAAAFKRDSKSIRLIYYAGLDHPETIRRFLVEFMVPLYDTLLTAILKGKASGEVKADINPYAAIRALQGALIYHFTYLYVFQAHKLHKFRIHQGDIKEYVEMWFAGVCS